MRMPNFNPSKPINKSIIITVFAVLIAATLAFSIKQSNPKEPMYRIAKIKVDPAQLDQYNAALKEQMTTAIAQEPGVLSYQAVANKKEPSEITILECYANTDAYKAHIETAHFKKYKETVKNMVTSLELQDVNLICAAKQPNQ